MLNYNYIKNYYKSIAVDLCRQKESDTNLKAVQKILFLVTADGTQSISVLTILEKLKETKLKFLQGCVTVFKKMLSYEEAKFKLTEELTKA